MFGREVETEILHVGDYINVEDEDIGVSKAVRIVRIERNLLKRHSYDITLSDTVTKSTTVRVLNEIEDINEVITINKLADPAKARRRWLATQELLNMVFDPEGDYYSEKIKPLSIETQMLSVGAKSTQFTLQNITFQPNYNKNPNTLYVSNGRLIHYAIEETIRTWVLSSATYSGLNPSAAYFIYAKCSTTGGGGQIILSTQAIKVEQEAGYYNFLIGVLNSVVTDAGGKNPGRLVSLTYGSTTINGRFLRTGRIESSGGGKCYFDLDNDEIGGVIRFVGTDGNYHDITDVQEKTDELKDYINNTLPGILGDLQGQLDGVIEQWFYAVDPAPENTAPLAAANEPAKEWADADTAAGNNNEKEKHLGDLYYNTDSGKVWRYVKGKVRPKPGAALSTADYYYWQELEDTELAQALALAQDALDAANDKAKIFVSTPYTPYHVGDLWVQGSTGDILRCKTERLTGAFNSGDWEKASKYTDNSALTNFINNNFLPTVNDIEGQIDGKIESWFQTTDPSTAWTTTAERRKHVGDMWYNGSTHTLKRYSETTYSYTNGQTGLTETGYGHYWTTIQDQKAIDAYEAANNAQDTADRKRQVFVKTPSGPYDIGDLWLRSWTDSTGVARKDLYRAIAARASGYNANDWAEATFYDNTQVTIDKGIITAGTVQLANGNSQSIVAGITGGENEAANETEARKVRIWAGASKANRFTAPFRVLQDGSFVATKGTITGTINANSGTIGGFEIGSGRIGTAASSTATTGSGLSLYGDFIKFANSYCWASIGTNVLPASSGMVGVGRFTNSTPNTYGTNYGLLLSVTGGLTNIALTATGAIVSNTYIESYGFLKITPAINTCHIPGDMSKPTIFRVLAKFTNSNSGIGLPTRGSIATVLGLGTNTAFAVRFTMVVDRSSTQTGYITGRNTFVKNSNGGNAMDTSQYPYRRNNNGGYESGKANMAAGDICEYLLVYDGNGGEYNAYCLNFRT